MFSLNHKGECWCCITYYCPVETCHVWYPEGLSKDWLLLLFLGMLLGDLCHTLLLILLLFPGVRLTAVWWQTLQGLNYFWSLYIVCYTSALVSTSSASAPYIGALWLGLPGSPPLLPGTHTRSFVGLLLVLLGIIRTTLEIQSTWIQWTGNFQLSLKNIPFLMGSTQSLVAWGPRMKDLFLTPRCFFATSWIFQWYMCMWNIKEIFGSDLGSTSIYQYPDSMYTEICYCNFPNIRYGGIALMEW